MCNFTNSEAFKVTLVDTAVNTNIAVRTKRIHSYVEEDESFMLMYGDGVADVDLESLVQFRQQHDGLVTLTSVKLHSQTLS